MAEHSFDEISRKIVDDYLRDIVFIDEEAFGTESNPNSFDAKIVSKCFADAGKICAIYAPVNDTDIDHCAILAHNADVLVVDWRLLLHRTKPVDPNADAKDDIRGEYTSELLHLVLDEAEDDKFKMVVIYTGETNFGKVYDDVCKELYDYPLTVQKESFSLSSKNIEIVVRAKNTFQYNSEWNKFVISYENLPIAIVDIFTEKVKGLLPNYALSAISRIRENTPKILSVFHKDMDAAYLGHEISIPNKEDAQKLLNTCLGSAIGELLQEEPIPMHEWYLAWIEDNIIEPYEVEYANKKKLKITSDFCKNLVNASGTKIYERINAVLIENQVSKSSESFFLEKSASLFGAKEDAQQQLSNNGFARLTQIRNLFGRSKNAPLLSLGTVVKNTQTGAFLLCIQQTCDSARIPLPEEGEKGRDFLFLPIMTQQKGVPIITNEDEILFVSVNSYAVTKIHFNPLQDGAPIAANAIENGWEFKSINNERYQWQFDIKESYALHIVNKYASQLTRVGVDIAECIRKKSE